MWVGAGADSWGPHFPSCSGGGNGWEVWTAVSPWNAKEIVWRPPKSSWSIILPIWENISSLGPWASHVLSRTRWPWVSIRCREASSRPFWTGRSGVEPTSLTLEAHSLLLGMLQSVSEGPPPSRPSVFREVAWRPQTSHTWVHSLPSSFVSRLLLDFSEPPFPCL